MSSSRLILAIGCLLATLSACSADTGGTANTGSASDSVAGPADCISFAPANDEVFNFPDDPIGIKIGNSPVGDKSDVYAIRIGDAVWITDAPPDGSDGGLTLPVNRAARKYDPILGADIDVENSVFAELASEAEDASAACH